MSVKVGSFAAPISTGSTAFTGVGFQPKALVVFTGNQATAGNITAYNFGVGACDSAMSQATIFTSHRPLPETAISMRYNNTKLVYTSQTGTETIGQVTSFDSDGFTINYTSIIANLAVTGYLAIGGAGITSTYLKEFNSPAGTGSQSYTGVGFKPDSIFLFGINKTTAPPNSGVGTCAFNFGVCDAALKQGGLSNYLALGINTSRWQRTDNVITQVGASEAQSFLAAVTSMDSDGFTLNWGTNAPGAGCYFWALCVKGTDEFKVGRLDMAAATGDQRILTGGHYPKAVMHFGEGIASNTSPQTNAVALCGLSDVSSEISVCSSSNDGTQNADNRMSTTKAITMINPSATLLAEADLTSVVDNSYNLNWTTADAVTREFIYWSVGVSAKKLLTIMGMGQ